MYNTINAVVFDLDGTLLSSHQNIYMATLKTLEKLKINVSLNEDLFYTKIGLHFKDIFEQMGIVINDTENFINEYKKVYFDFIDYSTPYPGLLDTLEYLYNKNIKINLLTTKAQDQAELILSHFNINKYFSVILGRKPDLKIKPDPDGIIYISKTLSIPPKNILMVGDAETDILCGKNAGSKTCAVTYGYRSKDFLLSLNPNFIINNLTELKNLV